MGKRGNGEGSIYKTSDGKWCGQYYLIKDGKKIRRSVYAKTRKEVKDKLQQKIEETSKGVVNESPKITLSEWIAQWFEFYKKISLKQTTYENYMINYTTHIKNAPLGQIEIGKLKTTYLQAFYNEKLEKGRSDGKGGLSSRTVRYLHILISGALEQAYHNEMIDRNVSKNVVLPANKPKQFEPLTIEEINDFLKVARDDRLYALYLLDITTGMRKGEILGLQWDNVDLQNKKIYVKYNLCRIIDSENKEGKKHKLVLMEPKTEKSKRTLPIKDDVVKVLVKHKEMQDKEKIAYKEIYQDNNMVFANEDGTYIHPRVLLDRFYSLLSKANVGKRRFHDIRHAFASILLNENENPKVIQELLGHSTISTTMDIYSHVLEETKLKSVDKLMAKITI